MAYFIGYNAPDNTGIQYQPCTKAEFEKLKLIHEFEEKEKEKDSYILTGNYTEF